MLGWIGKWAGSKGMGSIPFLSGLSLSAARSSITNAGFNLGSETPLDNSQGATALNNNTAKARTDEGQLLDYESTLGFEYYIYTAPPFFPPSFVSPPFFPFFPFFPPSFVGPFFPPFFPPYFPFFPPFFPPSFVAPVCGDCVTYNYTEDVCNGEDIYVGNFTKTRKECPVGSGNWVDCTSGTFVSYGACVATNVSACGGSGGAGTSPCPVAPFFPPFFPPSFVSPFFPPFFPPSFVSQSTWYFCCNDGTAESVLASNSSTAAQLATNICGQLGSSLGGGVYSTPQNCGPSPFFPPSFVSPFFPPFFPPSFVASPFFPPSFVASLPQCPGTITNPASATCAELGLTYLGNSSQYAIPSGQSCCGGAVTPFFPPFFPPSFVASPFFPPSFVASPFFPPSFVSGGGCVDTQWTNTASFQCFGIDYYVQQVSNCGNYRWALYEQFGCG